jgi:hypothetical protein
LKIISILSSVLLFTSYISGCGPHNPPVKNPEIVDAEVFFLKNGFVPLSDFTASSDTVASKVKINAFPTANFTPSLVKNGFTFADFRNDTSFLQLLPLIKMAATGTLPGGQLEDAQDKFVNFENMVSVWGHNHLAPGTSFDKVVCDFPVYRNTQQTGIVKGALNFAHVDFSNKQSLSSLFAANDFEKRLEMETEYSNASSPAFWNEHSLVTMLNFWMPIKPITAFPLAMADKSTLNLDDLVPVTMLLPNGNKFVGLILRHDAAQKFYYRRNLNVGEALVFETFKTPHFAFKLPEQYGDRESTEIRCAFIKKN